MSSKNYHRRLINFNAENAKGLTLKWVQEIILL